MIIKGMMFGDREFNFEDKSNLFLILVYAFDKKNHIFHKLYMGPGKNYKKKRDPQDFFHGSIYRLKSEFLQKFEKSMPRIFPTKDQII